MCREVNTEAQPGALFGEGSEQEVWRAQDRLRDAEGALAEFSQGKSHFLHLAQPWLPGARVVHHLLKSIHKQAQRKAKIKVFCLEHKWGWSTDPAAAQAVQWSCAMSCAWQIWGTAQAQGVWVTLHSWSGTHVTKLAARAEQLRRADSCEWHPALLSALGSLQQDPGAGMAPREQQSHPHPVPAPFCLLGIHSAQSARGMKISAASLVFAAGEKSRSLHASYLIDNIKPGEVAGEGKCFQLRSWTENSCGTESACWWQQLFS